MRQEETIETHHGHIFFGRTEGEVDQQDEQHHYCGTTHGCQKHDMIGDEALEEQARHRTNGEGEAREPGGRVVGLCALERLTGVDDEGAGEHHLGQAKGGTKGKALDDDQLQIAELE